MKHIYLFITILLLASQSIFAQWKSIPAISLYTHIYMSSDGYGYYDIDQDHWPDGYSTCTYGRIEKDSVISPALVDSSTGYCYNHLSILNDSTALFAFEQRTFMTRDSGRSYSSFGSMLNYSKKFFEIQLIDDSTGYLLADNHSPTENDSLYRVTPAGIDHISKLPHQIQKYFHLNRQREFMHFTSPRVGYLISNINAGGPGELYQTIDHGKTWQLVFNDLDAFVSVRFLDDLHGYVATSTNIYKTVDGGMNWSTLPNPLVSGNLINNLRFYDRNIGYLGCNHGEIFRTTDGGNTWQNDSCNLRGPSSTRILMRSLVKPGVAYSKAVYLTPTYGERIIKRIDTMPLNISPTIAASYGDAICQYDSSLSLNLKLTDDDIGSVAIVSVRSDNQTIVPNGNLKAVKTGNTVKLSVLPIPAKFGTANITVVIEDSSGTRDSTVFPVIIKLCSSDGYVEAIDSDTICLNDTLMKQLKLKLPDSLIKSISIKSNKQHLIKDQNITISGSGSRRNVTFVSRSTPGKNRIRVFIQDIFDQVDSTTFHIIIRDCSIWAGVELEELANVQVYPNPSTDKLFIDVGEQKNIEYRILSINGKEIISGRLAEPGSNELSLGHPPGVYILQLNKENHTDYRKLIIQ